MNDGEPSAMLRRTSTTRLLSLLLVVCAVISGLAACGGEDDSASELSRQRELRDARMEGARDARIRQLERELRAQKQGSGEEEEAATSSGGESTPPATGATSPASGTTSCGGGLSVGPNTSCPFAQNVRDAYFSSGGSSTVTAASPVTEQVYSMHCTAGSPHVCRGGNNASVFFP
jgi:hypothetical protein